MFKLIKEKLNNIKNTCKEAMVSKNKYMGSEEFNKKSIFKQVGVMTLTAWFQLIPISLYLLITTNPVMAKYTFVGFWVSALTLIPILNLIYVPIVKLINKSSIVTKIFSIFKSNKKVEGAVEAEYYKDNFIGRALYFIKATSTSLYTFMPLIILTNLFLMYLTYITLNMTVFFWVNFTLIFTLISSGLTSIYSIKLIKEIFKKIKKINKTEEKEVNNKDDNATYVPRRVTGNETFTASLYKEFDNNEVKK